jgi:hypothetical protein
MTDMRALSTWQFTRDFAKVRREPLTVTDRGQVLGVWTPHSNRPKPLDYFQRLKSYCKAPLPFTGAQLLRGGKKR